MSSTEQNLLLWVVCGLISILIAVFSWLGTSTVSKLDKIATSVNNMEKDLSVLANDHSNLKENHKELEKRVEKLEILKN
jgi:cell division protein FtsB